MRSPSLIGPSVIGLPRIVALNIVASGGSRQLVARPARPGLRDPAYTKRVGRTGPVANPGRPDGLSVIGDRQHRNLPSATRSSRAAPRCAYPGSTSEPRHTFRRAELGTATGKVGYAALPARFENRAI